MVLCMAGLSMQAQSQLVVKTTGGSTEKFALEQAPTVEFSVTYGETWVTVGDKVQKLDIESLHLENIPADSSVVYMCNHNSFFDVLITYVKIPYVFGFVSKKEVGKVPILHMWMRYVNCLFLDRNNIREGLKTILTGIDMVKNGTSLFIFPEGTRSKDGNMIPFKEGAMKLATKSKAPVIPIAMRGTSDIFESHLPFIKGSKVTMVVGKPIYIDELSPEDKKHSGAYVQGVIQNMLDEIDKNN